MAGGFCYKHNMVRLFFYVLLFFVAAFGAGPARAGYEDALQMVRQAKYQQAMAEFLPLAQEGHAASQFSMGLMYHLGRGVKTNPKTAYDWYKKAVLQDHPPAMNNMGMMYLNGDYVGRNREVAFKLFEKASADHQQAKDNVGQCYENGWGVERNAVQALNFYQLAGDAGFILGYFHIAKMYEKGYPDLPKNMDKAVEYYTLAAEADFNKARTRLIELKRLPDYLKK